MPQSRAQQAQAEYMQQLIDSAVAKKAQQDLQSIQGSVLVEVELSKAMQDKAKRLGFKPMQSTLVRLEEGVHEKTHGSIIPLQEEFYFHLALASRVYEEVAKDFFPTHHKQIINQENLAHLIKEAHLEAVTEVNRHIQHAYDEALKAATKKPPFNLATFNKVLDKARKTITPIAHTILMEKVIEKTGIVFTQKAFKKAKHIAENTPATTQDILYVNQTQGLATLIKGSAYTAHHRVRGHDFAHRQLITHHIDDQGKVVPRPHARIQIRTPSPVVKKGLKAHQIIQDVEDKLSYITQAYRLKRRLWGRPKAFIYNRYTAINDVLGDTSGNLQTQSAKHIIEGAHQYNTKQFSKGVFCLVQNISVNGFGDTLGYDSDDALVDESTLMAEMALMHTLGQIKIPFEHYENYLKSSPREKYFSQTKEGKQAIAAIREIKENFKTAIKQEKNLSIPTLAKRCLKKLIAEDAHFTHEYAKLIQTLSVYVEKASFGGCKSGNERAQAINGRVLMLDAAEGSGYDPIKTQLHLLAHATPEQVPFAAKHLKALIDKKYNEQGLYTAASMVSLADQGASAKVEAKPKGSYISRNYAEEAEALMPYLQQSKAGQMQAHKGLTKYMKSAWQAHPESFWGYMSSSFLGVFGAVLGSVTVLPAIITALVYARDKHLQAAHRIKRNERIQAFKHDVDEKMQAHALSWLSQIGDYGLSPEQSVVSLGPSAKKALYRGTHKGVEPRSAREDFIRFLSIEFLKEVPLRRDESHKNQAVKLKDLLGGEGLKLYKRAVEEESKSKSFRDAVFLKSLKHQAGSKWLKRLVLWVGGPSSAGKTYASDHILETLSTHVSKPLGETKGDNSGNDVAFIDGTFERETSQMRRMVLQMALATGYKGIVDLHKHSNALVVKGYVRDAALASEDINILIPDTFVRDPLAIEKEMTHYQQLGREGKVVQVFSEVKSQSAETRIARQLCAQHFKTAVKNMGESRAWGRAPFYAHQIAMNNTDIGCESKAYQKNYFQLGSECTAAARFVYQEKSQDGLMLEVENDLIYLKKDSAESWVFCEFSDDLTGQVEGKDFIRVTNRAYEAWLALKETEEGLPDLPTWYQQNKHDKALTGPVITLQGNEASKLSLATGLGSTGLGFFEQAPADEKGEQMATKKPLPPT